MPNNIPFSSVTIPTKHHQETNLSNMYPKKDQDTC